MMRFCFSMAMLALSLCSFANADTRKFTFRINKVDLKEGARVEEEILRECDVKKALDQSVAELHAKRSVSKKKPPPHYEINVRIDRLVRVERLSGPGGTELAVTVSSTSVSRPQYLTCRADQRTAIFNQTHCSRISYCGDQLAKQIAEWLALQQAASDASTKLVN